MRRKTGEAQPPVAELQASKQHPRALRELRDGLKKPLRCSLRNQREQENARILETGKEHSDFQKRGKTDSMNHKTGEPTTNFCKEVSCSLNEADFRACRKGSITRKANTQ